MAYKRDENQDGESRWEQFLLSLFCSHNEILLLFGFYLLVDLFANPFIKDIQTFTLAPKMQFVGVLNTLPGRSGLQFSTMWPTSPLSEVA
jgi:hypothetical protein